MPIPPTWQLRQTSLTYKQFKKLVQVSDMFRICNVRILVHYTVGYSHGLLYTDPWAEHNPQHCKCLDFNSNNAENQTSIGVYINALWCVGDWWYSKKNIFLKGYTMHHAFIFLRLRRWVKPLSVLSVEISVSHTNRLLPRWNKSWRSNNPAAMENIWD